MWSYVKGTYKVIIRNQMWSNYFLSINYVRNSFIASTAGTGRAVRILHPPLGPGGLVGGELGPDGLEHVTAVDVRLGPLAELQLAEGGHAEAPSRQGML
jgi:hypothetical protein